MKNNAISLLLYVFSGIVFIKPPGLCWSQNRSIEGIVAITPKGQSIELYRKSYALVIGVSSYTEGWPTLPYPINDAVEVKTALEKHGFQVTLLQNPTSSKLKNMIIDFVSKTGSEPNCRLLFYFAGHGHTILKSYGDKVGYIVPSDAPLPDQDMPGFLQKALSMENFNTYARDIEAKHALFLFDCCFSGSIFALSRAVPEAISSKTSFPVRQFITAGNEEETVPDKSEFKTQFIAALEGEADANHDGYVTGTELGEFLQERVENYTRSAQHPQYGKIRDPKLDKGDFVFTLKPEQDVSVKSAESHGIEFVLIQGGTFEMGDLFADGEAEEKPVHTVTLPDFYLGKTEVTVTQYRAFCDATGKSMPPEPNEGWKDNQPIVNVTWNDAKAFCDWSGCRLPTEAEWEYAAREKGRKVRFGNGKDIANTSEMNFDGKVDDKKPYSEVGASLGRTLPVGFFPPNALGLYEMSGNVWEWCSDWFGNYSEESLQNPRGPKSGSYRIMRGGSWFYNPWYCRTSIRGWSDPDGSTKNLGFRVAK